MTGLAGCGSGADSAADSGESGTGTSGLYGSGATAEVPKPALPPIPEGPETLVEITTDYGTMTAKLYNGTPKHRENFIKLASKGYYDDLLFHRVIAGFMIQGGDPDSRGAAPSVQLGQGGPEYKIPAEIRPEYVHKKGALAAARMGDQINPERASSGSQFYIVQGTLHTPQSLGPMEAQNGYTGAQKETYFSVGGTPQLDGGYTVFGEVIDGLDVIDKIAAVQTGAGDRPAKDVKMKVRVLDNE
ncbi:MAG: peptidylprolyl isomerase [Bacteroidetes bacterium]|nr:peptidylprolyl isomerase [Bacteroidota bacterium]